MTYAIRKADMRPHQRAWWDLDHYIRLLVGGKGCGKTHIGALRAIWLSHVNAPAPGICVSPSYPIAWRTIIPTLKSMLRRAGLSYHYNDLRKAFHIRDWDGAIWLGSGELPDSLVGPTLAWAWIDEPFLQKKGVFDEMIARVRHADAARREINLTGTPEALNWGYDVAMNDEGRYDLGMVVGRTRDNPSIPSQTIAAMEMAYTEQMRAAYLEGRFVNLTAGRVYSPFDRDRHLLSRPHLPASRLLLEAGIDFNVDHMTALVFVRGPNWLHVIDELRLSNANTFQLAAALGETYRGITVYPDPAGNARHSSATRSDHQILRDGGFTVVAHRAAPPVRDRVNAVNGLLLGNDDGGPLLTLEPGRCPWLVKDLEQNVWRSGEIDKLSDRSATHAADALGYAVEYQFPIQPQGVTYGQRW